MDFTPHQFAQRVVELGLVEQHEMDKVWSEVGLSDATVEDVVAALLRRVADKLTSGPSSKGRANRLFLRPIKSFI
ncbi:MAG: hypothetical protein U0930_21915 [Pirellulales bacterium]